MTTTTKQDQPNTDVTLAKALSKDPYDVPDPNREPPAPRATAMGIVGHCH